MNFLIVSQHFFPDSFRINEIAFALRRQGHGVRVLTGLPDYDANALPAAYRWFRKRREEIQGVEVVRVPTTRRRTGAFWRLINYASFVVSGWLYACFAKKGVDVVLTYETSPVSQAIPAIRLARRNRCPHILYCLDLWPESVKVWGVRERSALYGMVWRVSRAVYRAADRVAVSSAPFVQYLHEVNDVQAARIDYLPQPCEDLFEQVAGQYEENGVVDFLFAGNVGSAQDLPCLLEAVALLRGKSGFHVHIVGAGTEWAAMCALSARMGLEERVTFYGRKPLEQMPAYYRMADAFLLTLKGGDFVGQTLPGKLQSYMSAGKPIVAAIDGAGASVLREAQCGLCGPASDSAALARNMADMVDNAVQHRAMGARALAYYQQNFRTDVFLARLGQIIQEAKGGQAHV